MRDAYNMAEQTIDASDRRALIEWLETAPWLTQGPLVAEFERRWAAWLGSRHAVFVNSGSSANLLMYYALLVSGRPSSSGSSRSCARPTASTSAST